MSNNINSDTDFSNLTISNDYPCLVGGTWTAELVDGKTVYTNGTETYSGPVNLIGGTLNIDSGAVVNGLTAVDAATINITNGGTLENSDTFLGTVNIQTGGLSENNNYVSTAVNLSSSSTSTNDSFYRPVATSTSSGTLDLKELPASQSKTFQTSSGTGYITTPSGAATTDLTINNPHYYGNSTLGYLDTIYLTHGSSYGDPATAVGQDPALYTTNGAFTLSNNYPTYVGGTWTASVVNGVTVYSATGVTGGMSTGTVTDVTGPLNLVAITSLTVNTGAVVDGITITNSTTTYPPIYNSGTIQNSFIANGYLYNMNGGLSQNNTFISEVYYGEAGGTSKNDYFYEPGTYVTGNYNLTNTNGATLGELLLADGGAIQIIYPGSTYDGSYIETGPESSGLYIDSYYAANVSCFLAGSMINTPNGLIAVEDIKVGDYIVCYNEDQQENRTVIWTGYNTVSVNALLPEDEANYPVRVLKNAIADNVPSKDLLVTQEHCLLINNQFIPVRMLVNNSTIFYDHSITEYTYYHIETETHSVIMADGTLTESYLDTGNRASFKSNGNIVSIVNKKKQWNLDSAAPLVTTRNIVELIFYKLLARAHMLGFPYNLPTLPTTTDYGLYLLTDNNEVIEVAYQSHKRFAFKIPEYVKNVRLMSHTNQPSKTIGAFVDDRRHLGVLVGSVTLLEHNESYSIDTHLRSTHLQGWDVQENPYYRWTNGSALLPIRKEESHHTTVLIVHIVDGGPYLLPTTQELQVNSK